MELLLSLPSRERGLKFASKSSMDNVEPSLPSRERGLKCTMCDYPAKPSYCRSLRGSEDWNHAVQFCFICSGQSLPPRERGLKSVIIYQVVIAAPSFSPQAPGLKLHKVPPPRIQPCRFLRGTWIKIYKTWRLFSDDVSGNKITEMLRDRFFGRTRLPVTSHW